jgi:hypothetical protein
MFAIDHAATALLLERRYPAVSLPPLLVSVQAMELAWVGLNYAGIESTHTDPVVRTVANIHLAYMPWSHSLLTPILFALLVWLVVEKGLGRAPLGRALALGIVSHLVLDLLTHNHDIVPAPGLRSPGLGLGLYGAAPMAAFALELVYGVACWWIYRGSRALLVLIVVANVANISLFSAAIPGPEEWLAGRPLLVVTVILAQIALTLFLVGLLARPRRDRASVSGASPSRAP